MTATATDTMTTEAALWQAVGANPADELVRLVLADWLEENAGVVRCETCEGNGNKKVAASGRVTIGKAIYPGTGFSYECRTCSGTGYIPDGRQDTADGLRATKDRVPTKFQGPVMSWQRSAAPFVQPFYVSAEVWGKMTGDVTLVAFRDYPTAELAIRDLVRAWILVNRGVA